MKRIKLIVAMLAATLVLGSFSVSAKPVTVGFGVVDINKVVDNYTEAQKVTADYNVKEKTLKNFVDDANQKINAAKTPLEKKNLQEKFGEELAIKRDAYAKEQAEKWAKIEDNINKAIQQVYTENKYNIILTKQAVLAGGTDITEDLLKKLNAPAKAPATK